MRANTLGALLLTGAMLLAPATGLGQNSRDITRLKQAGFTGTTLQLIIREKTIETAALSVDDLLALKQAGISESTIQMIIQGRSSRPERRYREYGTTTASVDHVSIGDLMAMKEQGFSDDVLQALIIYRSANYAQTERERAWRMLSQMGIVIDGRPWIDPTPKN